MNYFLDFIIKAMGMKAIKTDPNIEGADEVGAGTGHKLTPSVLNAAKEGRGWKLEYVSDDKDRAELEKLGQTPVYVYRDKSGNIAMTQSEKIAEAVSDDKGYQEMPLSDVWKGKYSTMDEEGELEHTTFDPKSIREETLHHPDHNPAYVTVYADKSIHHEYMDKLGGQNYAKAQEKKYKLVERSSHRGFGIALAKEGEEAVSLTGLLHLADITKNSDLEKVILKYMDKGTATSDDLGGKDLPVIPGVDAESQKALETYMKPAITQEFLHKILNAGSRHAVRRILMDTYRDFAEAQDKAANRVVQARPVPIVDSSRPAQPLATGAERVAEAIDNKKQGFYTPDRLLFSGYQEKGMGKFSGEEVGIALKKASESEEYDMAESTALSSIEAVFPNEDKSVKDGLMEKLLPALALSKPNYGWIGSRIYAELQNALPEPKYKDLRDEVAGRIKAMDDYSTYTLKVSNGSSTANLSFGAARMVMTAAKAADKRKSDKGENIAYAESKAQFLRQNQMADIIQSMGHDILAQGCVYTGNGNYADGAALIACARHLPVKTIFNPDGSSKGIEITAGPEAGLKVTKDSETVLKRKALKALHDWLHETGGSYAEVLHNNIRAARERDGRNSTGLEVQPDSENLYTKNQAYMESIIDSMNTSVQGITNHIFGGESSSKFMDSATGQIAGADPDAQLANIQKMKSNLDSLYSIQDSSGKTGYDMAIENFLSGVAGNSNVHLEPEVIESLIKPIFHASIMSIREALDRAEDSVTNAKTDTSLSLEKRKRKGTIKKLGDYLEKLHIITSALPVIAQHGVKGTTISGAPQGQLAITQALDGLRAGTFHSEGNLPEVTSSGDIYIGVKGKDGKVSEIHNIGKRGFGNATNGSLDIAHSVIGLEPNQDGVPEPVYTLMGSEVKWKKTTKAKAESANFNFANDVIKHIDEMSKIFPRVRLSSVKKITGVFEGAGAVQNSNRKRKSYKMKDLKFNFPTARSYTSSSISGNAYASGNYSVYSGCHALWEANEEEN